MFTVKNAATNALNKPCVPKNPTSRAPVLGSGLTAKNRKADIAAIMVEVEFIAFPSGMVLLKLPVNALAVVPATISPIIPMVKLYILTIISLALSGNTMPKRVGN